MMVGTSRLAIACMALLPMPGQAKMLSVSTAPPRRWAKSSPKRVRAGRAALGMAWRAMIRPSGRPLARAVRT
ncbi:hypothetical protein D3C86_1782320 [compost metagenome]